MRHCQSLLTISVVTCLLTAPPIHAGTETNDPLIQALTQGKVSGNFRLRYEQVDDNTNKDADALTLRSRLGYETGELAGFSALIEFEDVRSVLGVDDYAPEQPGYAVIADPEVSEVNRASLHYRGFSGTDLGLGRQRIVLDNARFVGNVGWRQDEQTFDSFAASFNGIKDLSLFYAHINQVNGITSGFDADTDDHLINIQYRGWAAGTLTGYAYLLENRDSDASTDSYGASWQGQWKWNDKVALAYRAEYARQRAEPLSTRFDSDYWLLEAGLQMGPITTKLGYEILGSDGGDYGFQTPYATKHAFNGWADKFLVTPNDGLRDTYLELGGTAAGIKLSVVYHRFDADHGSDDYGDEWNLLAAKAFGKHYKVGLKYAAYNAEDFSADTDKLWLWGEISF